MIINLINSFRLNKWIRPIYLKHNELLFRRNFIGLTRIWSIRIEQMRIRSDELTLEPMNRIACGDFDCIESSFNAMLPIDFVRPSLFLACASFLWLRCVALATFANLLRIMHVCIIICIFNKSHMERNYCFYTNNKTMLEMAMRCSSQFADTWAYAQ